MNPTNSKRPRIAKGILVTSTNAVVRECAKALTIAHYYNPLSYNRVRRVVIN